MKENNIKDKRFGRLTAVKKDSKTDHGNWIWECKCDCGNTISVPSGRLTRGGTKSCGCLRKELQQNNNKYHGRKPIGEACITRLFYNYKYGAKKRNLPFELTREEFKKLIGLNCFYCDAPPSNFYKFSDKTLTDEWKQLNDLTYNGIDRKHSYLGYNITNCVPCCRICNIMKWKLSPVEFLNHAELVVRNKDNILKKINGSSSIEKKKVSSSHLHLRFYKKFGWTKDILECYLVKGQLVDTETEKGDKPEMSYFILEVGGVLDMERLLKEQVSEVQRWYEGPERESDLDYMNSFNW